MWPDSKSRDKEVHSIYHETMARRWIYFPYREVTILGSRESYLLKSKGVYTHTQEVVLNI